MKLLTRSFRSFEIKQTDQRIRRLDRLQVFHSSDCIGNALRVGRLRVLGKEAHHLIHANHRGVWGSDHLCTHGTNREYPGECNQLLLSEVVIGIAQHAAAIVDDLDQSLAAGFDVHANAVGAGVERVLKQFLDDRGGALHDLAGGDLVGDVLGEDVNFTHGKEKS
jgi:hypothetical protein